MKSIKFYKTEINRVIAQLKYFFLELKDKKEYVMEIREVREKRSLDANAYYWRLLGEIAKVIETGKDELHEEMLRRYGAFMEDENGVAVKISTITEIDPLKCGIHCKSIGVSELNGCQYYHYILIKGSRYYDSKEMYHLIQGIISEAKELDIETLTPDEIARLNYEK